MPNLSHRELSNLGTLLGYKKLENGICRGFSMMWIQAVLAGEEKKFFERLAFINHHKHDFKQLKENIEKAMQRKNKEEIDENTQKLLDIIALFDGISLYLNPNVNKEIFPAETEVTQENFDVIYPIVKSKRLEDNNLDLSMLMEKVHAFESFDKESLKNYLMDLKKVLQNTHAELPILLESDKHSTALRYDNSKDRWYFIDTNRLHQYSESSYPPGIKEEDLVDSIFYSFNPAPANPFFKQAVIVTKVFGSKVQLKEQYTGPTSIEEDLLNFDLKYPITTKETKIYSEDGSNVLHLACRLNKINAVKDILNQADLNTNAIGSAGKTALGMACSAGFNDIVKLLIKIPNVQINLVDKENVNPFYSSCQWGNVEAVRLLLETGKIDINRKGITGHSPLQVACLSPYTIKVQILFELLLDNQASLTCLNDEGETALDIALKQNNETAILTLLQFIESRKINPYSVISSFSLEELINNTNTSFPQFTNYLNNYAEKENTLPLEIKDKLNNFTPDLTNSVEKYLSNAKGACLEDDVIKIPLSCIPINNIKSLQKEFKKFLPSPLMMLIK